MAVGSQIHSLYRMNGSINGYLCTTYINIPILQVVGVAAIALGSYVVHIARLQGGLSVVLGTGAILIVAGIVVVLVISAGLYGAVALSKIMLGIVSCLFFSSHSLAICMCCLTVHLLCGAHHYLGNCGSHPCFCLQRKDCKYYNNVCMMCNV